MTERANAREAILDAAEKLITEQGVHTLSFDALSKAAGISRGGILYHFASKDALIQAMVARLLQRFQDILAQEIAADPEPYGRFLRAFARSTFRMDRETAQVFSGLIAAIAYDPRLLDPLREYWTTWQQQGEEELDPATAAVVQMASHALWLNGLFGMTRYTPEQQDAIVKVLEKMTYPPV